MQKQPVSSGEEEPKLGIRASAPANSSLKLPYSCENLLGNEGDVQIAMTVLDAGRIGIGAQALDCRGSLRSARQYAGEREAFGQKSASQNRVQIADMKTRIEASACLSIMPHWRRTFKSTHERFSLEAAMPNYSHRRQPCSAHIRCQIHGGIGYSKELPVEPISVMQNHRNLRRHQRIQRMVISRAELNLK